jgi:CubicO group peptidase (beta-lactamase class C family)
VNRFFPEFTYRAEGWQEYLKHANQPIQPKKIEPITLRQLASHMSGIGRDYPSVNFEDWPHGTPPGFPPESGFPTKKEIMKSITENPLVAPQYSYPIYSNTGFALLGWCNTAADETVTGNSISHAEIIHRDIIEPLGLNGSSFILSHQNFDHMAFPKISLEAVSMMQLESLAKTSTHISLGARYDGFP